MSIRPQLIALLSMVVFSVVSSAQETTVDDPVVDAGVHADMTRLLDNAVKKLALSRNQEALDRLEQKDHPGALELLKQAYDLDAENPEIANNLGYLFFVLGNTDEAEQYLRRSLALDPERFVAYINLADLLGREGETPSRLSEAAALLEKVREIHGNNPRVILRQARVARLREAFQDAMRFYREYVAIRKPTDKLLIEIGDFFREMGQDDEAFGWYQQVTNADQWGKAAATRIWDIEVERQAKKYGWSPKSDKIPAQARRLLEKGEQFFSKGAHDDARQAFEQAIALAPGFAAARVRLGDLLKETGAFEAAELAYLRALAVDSGNAEIYLRLGVLYLHAEHAPRYMDATLYLRRALDLRPGWGAAHLALGKALQKTGELSGALKHIDIYLADAPKGPSRTEAGRLKKRLEKLLGKDRPAETALSKETARDNGISEALFTALNRARAHLAKGRPDAAMAELRRLPKGEKGPLVLNLEASILHVSGRLDKAAQVLRASLVMDARQPDIHEELGLILVELGKPEAARAHFVKAERLGNSAAKYYLARMAVQGESGDVGTLLNDVSRLGELWSAKERIDDYLLGGKGRIYIEEASVVDRELSRRLWTVAAAAAIVVLLLGGGLLLVTRRLWGGVDLGQLLEKHPDAGPEVQQVLSAIRHEVLKHNTMALGGVIESFERNAPDAIEKARHFKRTLLTSKGDTVPERLEKYTVDLSKIGRSFGLRLNLKQKEPAIRLLFKGFGILTKELRALGNGTVRGGTEKKRMLKQLKKAYHLLNVEGYDAVQQMLGRIRKLAVDEAMIRGIALRVLREPGFADIDVAPVAIEAKVDWPVPVLISRRAFEDIFANLIRNALQSSVAVGHSPCEVGVQANVEVDAVTGYERAVFLVCDHSDRILNTEMIRGQAIEGGLGLTAELVSRYDGMIDVVENVRGWSKAVRVKLPMAPLGNEEGAL